MKAIVYTSNTGHTRAYADLLARKTGLPAYTLENASTQLEKGSPIIYLGWLFASSIKGYKKAAGRFSISAICAVGLCDTGTAVDSVRKTNSLPETTPLFTIQGGMDKTRLRGINKMMISMLIKGMSKKTKKTESDERMLFLLTHDANYVCEENTLAFMEWYNAQIKNTCP